MIITEKVSFEMVGLYKWLIEDGIDERKFKEETLTEFINKAVENELKARKIDLTPRENYKLEDWWDERDEPKPRIYKIAQ